MERAPAGPLYICTGETDVTTRRLAEAIGQALNAPARALPRADVENRASSMKGPRELGWRLQAKCGLLDDITKGSYSEMTKRLRQKEMV